MHILFTGGTGLVGSALISYLCARGEDITVITRDVSSARQRLSENTVTYCSDMEQLRNLDNVDAVINLAGEPIASRRWTPEQKQKICQSRWAITEQLTKLIKASSTPPAVFISASASGYYGDCGDQILTETANVSDEFTHQLCQRWESLASVANSTSTRVCLLRTGVVLSKKGGAFPPLKRATSFCLGGKISSGKQFFPWIHIQDMVNAIGWLVDNPSCQGPFNLVAPQAIQQGELANQLAAMLHRPAWMRMPAWLLSLIMGESAILLLASQRLVPERLLQSGFQFRFPDINSALHQLINN